VNIDAFACQPYPEEDSVIRFNFVGRIVGFKGIGEFLECAKRIKAKYFNTEFVIYGSYVDDDGGYKAQIEMLEKDGIVKYGGVQLDMKPYIAKAHAVIHSSYYEGMTNVILEHAAMGRPAIASDIPGCKEGIDNGISGFTFPLQDVDALVGVVEKFIKMSPKDRAYMGKMARKKMEREFDRTIVTNIYIDEIKSALKI
jgi:galacturonosyltransferase